MHRAQALPEQMDVEAAFGNPPVTLFAGLRFHIDVYFWLDGTTEIHQHAFAGRLHDAPVVLGDLPVEELMAQR